MFEKILIANRGEIALRIIRAAKELGLKTIAVYSEADINSLHVHLADEAICIGPPSPAESYLRSDRILAAAEITNADAIHPGYGFLSENARFADLCRSCHITFVGPSPRTIALMGDKASAKAVAKKAKVPTIPGSNGIIENEYEGLKFAKKIGFPVLLKAAAGGGGKGMRLVHTEVAFSKDFGIARGEAEKNFGNGALYLEKFLENPRHIEFQVLADGCGNVVHLGERDCSIQRRYQKLVEEAPSPHLHQNLRKKMGEAAVRIAKACDYENAGTIEFLLDSHGNFYFMEMNTRIQVEHGITEAITGVDLVQWQLRIARGDPLNFTQKEVRILGHAIECRINAEDAARNFTPQPGEISLYYSPGGNGVRIDSHAYGGYRIPQYYDSMIGKVIAFGKNRDEAIARMDQALSGYIVRGPMTNISYQRAIIRDPIFRSGMVDTNFINSFIERLPEGLLEKIL
ncbi:MAG: acetyl-CoA carboxylase biotin carboxylase subunit [Puniceicoccales bacterium]|jgi:acetyl-CoA carboxylase biotin carboxylase subunit|nr:acetyl-CoA carboxylase biotin carboxylase subunit [Puniceicoccales bacterium]